MNYMCNHPYPNAQETDNQKNWPTEDLGRNLIPIINVCMTLVRAYNLSETRAEWGSRLCFLLLEVLF